jgi:hypothetical protein
MRKIYLNKMYKYLARPYLGVEFLVVLGGLGALVRIRGIVNDRLVFAKEQLLNKVLVLGN